MYRYRLVPFGLALGFLLFTQVATKKEDPINPTNFDLTEKPADDFYQYAVGGWLAKNPIPADKTSWQSFSVVDEKNQEILHSILQDCAKHVNAGGIQQQIGQLYLSGMDEKAINSAGIAPIKNLLDAIDQTTNLSELTAVFHRLGMNCFFNEGVGPDEKNSGFNIYQLGQGGLGLPDRDYYLKEDEKSVALRQKYLQFLTNIFKLIGDSASDASAKLVLAFETELAKASKTNVQLRDPQSNYHKMSLAEMEALTPNFPWKSYFTKLGLKPNQMEQVVVGQPEFLRRFGELVKTVPKEYLRWNVIRSTASYLSEPYVQEVFDFYGKTLSGLKELKPRWKRVLSVVDGNLGEALGQLYVAKAFPPEAKKQALTMVKDIQNALRGILKNLEWMGPETRAQAIKKLDAMTVKIGYPDKWRDYSKYHVKDQAYILNILAGQEFDTDYHLEMVGKPVDRTLWAMTPAAVNAYYNPVQNEIVFPAGILQPPFFDFQADIAVNYGGIGAVIGHEITHGFDDQGRQYDADGNLKNWWTAEDEKNFKARAQKIVTQFNAYVPIDDLHINGELTEGENIADLGGVKIAFKALQAALARSPQTGKIGNFTPIQRFFLSWAQVWECNTRPEALRLQLLTDPHSPAKYRVNGPLSNLPEFAEAFQIPQGSPMARPASERVEIW